MGNHLNQLNRKRFVQIQLIQNRARRRKRKTKIDHNLNRDQEVLKRRKTKKIKKKRKRKKTKTRQEIPDRTRARKSCHQNPKNLLPRSKSILQLQPPSILICQAVPRQKNQHLF